jgi:hypothetical protein
VAKTGYTQVIFLRKFPQAVIDEQFDEAIQDQSGMKILIFLQLQGLKNFVKTLLQPLETMSNLQLHFF